MSMYQPTSEQQAALEAFATGEDVVIVAGAGTGKTSTLRMLAASRPTSRGLYLAFNKAIASEAASSFPRSVQARTAHSLAFGWAKRDQVASGVLERLNAARRSPEEVIDFLDLTPMKVATKAGETTFTARSVYRWVGEILTAFQQSADPELDPTRHLPHVPGVDGATLAGIGSALHPAAVRAWEEMCDPRGGMLSVSHATYLKLWGLACPRIPGEFVLFDEAQDASPVIAAVVGAQECQRVMVGDPAQAIYRFTGAVDAMSTFEATHRLPLSRSWRFGQQAAAAANSYLQLLGQDLRLSGNPEVQTSLVSQCRRPQAVLCRGNAMAIAEAMAGQQTGARIHIVGGVAEPRRFVEAAEQLQTTGRCTHPELAYFPSWEAVREHVEDGADAGLRTLVRLVDEFGTATLQQVLAACTDREQQADMLVSTVHKAKGREWDAVDLADDLDPTDAIEALSSADEEERAKARDELHIGYVAVTRARRELGAGPVAEGLDPHGFPALEAGPAAQDEIHCGASGAPVIVAGNQPREWVSIAIRPDLWQALVARYGHPDSAGMVAGLLLENVLTGRTAPAPAAIIGDGAADQVSAGDAGPLQSSRPASSSDYGLVADETLGVEAADAVRALLDAAVQAVVEATGGAGAGREGFSDEDLMAMLVQAVTQTGLTIHRARGVGYSLTTTITGEPVRLTGSNFGAGYSGPGLLRTLRAR